MVNVGKAFGLELLLNVLAAVNTCAVVYKPKNQSTIKDYRMCTVL
jgi:hypothetical protein